MRTLPVSYRTLNEFAVRYPAGARVYDQDGEPGAFYVILSGTVTLEVRDERRALTSQVTVGRGHLFGHLAAFAERPTATAAVVKEDAVLLAVPIERAASAFGLAPELAIEVARELAAHLPEHADVELPEIVADDEASPEPPAAPEAEQAEVDPNAVELATAPPLRGARSRIGSGGDAVIEGGWMRAVTRLTAAYDEVFFFKDTTQCPACETHFEYLRVRTVGIRPEKRDSDFHVTYRSDDPTRYGVVVCPTCSYAATHEDFATLRPEERKAIVANRQARGRYDYPNLGGPRTLEETVTTLELAQMCYQHRRANERRSAVLLHRRAWLERERGDEAAERDWLTKARDAYRRSFELDGQISEESAMRVAYLLGDLSLRLGEPHEGARWLETATRFPKAKSQSGLERVARDRLSDARKLLAELEAEKKSA
jgi:uncharacterized protein (DUF2225 family)